MTLVSKFVGVACAVLTAGMWILTFTTGMTPNDIGVAVVLTAIVAATFALSLWP
jgi:hypothetical protein